MTTLPSSTQIAKGRQLLDRLVTEKQMSQEGKQWLTFALDPFHDKEIKGIDGIPDGNTGKSVVCSLVQELQIKKPGTMAAGNWACRIATYPVATHLNLSNAKVMNNLINNTDNGPNIIAPVVVDYALDGLDFHEFNFGANYLAIPSQYTKGPYKVGAMGVEVVNTTSDLYKQGLVTCARMNQTSCTPATFQLFGNSVGVNTYLDCVPIRTAPVNLSQMTLLTGNTAWKAAEGAYSVVSLKSINDANATSKPVYPLLLSSDFQSDDIATVINGAAPIINASAVPGLAIPGNPAITHTTGFPGQVPMDTTVIMFTGLSEQTTLTVRARWMLERFPNDVESDIVVLAKETAAYDPIALSVYSQVMQTVPAAVMFRENPQGEWWKTILGSLADVVGSGLAMLPHPVAKAAGAAILTGNKLLNSENATNKAITNGNGELVVVQRQASKKKQKQKKDKKKSNAPSSGTVNV